jgi:hypothetical protein
MVTVPGITGMGPEHEPTGTVIELLGAEVNAGLVNVKFPVTGFTLDDDLQTSRKEHGTASATAVSSASFSPPVAGFSVNALGRNA